jgi:hypothetical protein
MVKKNTPKNKDLKLFGTRMDIKLLKQLKMLGLKNDRAVYSLVEEAVTDLLRKYGQI